MERERAEEGEGAYKEVIIVKANCWIQARQEAVRKWGEGGGGRRGETL